jgi:glycosyltransferase involved in cell wall biosynthesis
MGAGLALVAAAVGGIPEVIRHDRNGLLLRLDRGDLTAQLHRLIRDAGLRERLGRQARLDARELTWNHIARRTHAVYESVLTGRMPPRTALP